MLSANLLNWTTTVARQLRQLELPAQVLIVDAVSRLATMPDCDGVTALADVQFGYRLQAGEYNVIFEWFNELNVTNIIKAAEV